MKKILFILPHLNSGGAEKVTINFIRQLKKEKFDISLVVLKKTEQLLDLVPQNVKLVDLETKSTKKSFLKLTKYIKHNPQDVVFTSHSRLAFLVMLLKPFVKKFQHIARMQSSPVLEKKYSEYSFIVRFLYMLGFRSADVVIAQTKQMKKEALEVFKLNEYKVTVMNNPLDTINIDKLLRDASSPFLEKEVNIVVSGRLRKEKGYDVLIKALPVILKEIPNLKLYVLGSDNGEYNSLKTLMEKFGLENNIIFLGFKKNPYIYYKYCDLFVLSSRREGFPNALLENYYLNTPIVATRCVPIVSELIEDGVNGYTCDVDDINCLSEKIISCMQNIKRKDIKNPEYMGSKLEELF